MSTLLSIIEHLDEQDADATIYAVEPWKPESAAFVAIESSSDSPAAGMTYLLEIAIALEVLEDWDPTLRRSALERCQRVIEYAVNDA